MTRPADELPREVAELCIAADGLEAGLAKIALLEQAVQHSDTLRNVPSSYRVREKLIDAAVFGGRPDVALVAFSWCMAQSDAAPDLYNYRNLLWKYKWIINALTELPQVRRSQIEDSLDDFEARVLQAGFSRYTIEMLRWKVAAKLEDFAAAEDARQRLGQFRRDGLSDCPACDQDWRASFSALMQDAVGAIRAAQPILDGRLRCSQVPHVTYAELLMPYFQLGQLEEAADCHRRGYRMISRNPTFVREWGDHLQFLALTANLTRATQLLASQLPAALVAVDQRGRFEFLRATDIVLRCLKNQDRTTVKLRLPPTVPFVTPNGTYSIAEILAWIHQAAADLAARFDERNGNSALSDKLARNESLSAEIRPYPLRSKLSGDSDRQQTAI